MRAVDLKFKKEVDRFIRDNPVTDLDTEVYNLLSMNCYHRKINTSTIQRILRHEGTRKSFYGFTMLNKLISALKIKSPKFSVPTSIELVLQHISNDPAPFVFTLSFTFKHDSGVSPDYLLYEIIYPRLNTIFLSVHEQCNVVFGLSKILFFNTLTTSAPTTATTVLAEDGDLPESLDAQERVSDSINRQEESAVVSSLTLSYLLFPCPEDAAFPLCSIFMGNSSGIVMQSIQEDPSITMY